MSTPQHKFLVAPLIKGVISRQGWERGKERGWKGRGKEEGRNRKGKEGRGKGTEGMGGTVRERREKRKGREREEKGYSPQT